MTKMPGRIHLQRHNSCLIRASYWPRALERQVSRVSPLPLADHAKQFAGPFNLITESGPIIILPPESVEAVNAESNLSFTDWVRVEHLSKYNTFRTMRPWPPGMFVEAILKGITRPLRRYPSPIYLSAQADEASFQHDLRNRCL